MAFLNKIPGQEERQGFGLAGAPQSSVNDAFVGSGGASAAPSSQPAPNIGGSAWTNLSTYLNANQGAGGQLANQVTNTAQAKVDAGNAALSNLESGFKGAVDTAKVSPNSDLINRIKTDPTKVTRGEYVAATKGYSPTGPQDLGSYADYAGAKKAFDVGNEAQANIGERKTQRALLDEAYGSQGRYSRGMSNLDSFILQQEASAQPTLSAFQAKNAGYGGRLAATEGNLGTYLTNAKAESDLGAQRTREAVGSTRQGILDKINREITSRDEALKTKAIFEADPTRKAVVERYAADSSPDVAGYIKRANPDKLTTNQAMTADERARLQALADLDLSQGPGADEGYNPYSFDAEAYARALDKAKEDAKAKQDIANTVQNVVTTAVGENKPGVQTPNVLNPVSSSLPKEAQAWLPAVKTERIGWRQFGVNVPILTVQNPGEVIRQVGVPRVADPSTPQVKTTVYDALRDIVAPPQLPSVSKRFKVF